jgi:hypothetical protein
MPIQVVRMRRGWRLRLTDNEFALLRVAVNRGLAAIDGDTAEALPYKVRKVLLSDRWSLLGPLTLDEDRRPPAANVVAS